MATSPGAGASVDLAQLLQPAFQVSTILTVFGFGLRAGVEDVLYLVRHPRMLLISLVSMFIVMPFVALGLALMDFLGALMGRPFRQGPAAVAARLCWPWCSPWRRACCFARSCPVWHTGSKGPLRGSRRW